MKSTITDVAIIEGRSNAVRFLRLFYNPNRYIIHTYTPTHATLKRFEATLGEPNLDLDGLRIYSLRKE